MATSLTDWCRPDLIGEAPPFTDYALVLGATSLEGLPSMLTTQSLGGSCSLVAPVGHASANDVLAFSGFALAPGRLLSSVSDVGEHLDRAGALPRSGCYSCLHRTADSLVLSSDAFGTHPLYHYDNGKQQMFSPRLHLLLEVVRAMGWPLCRDDEALLTRLFPVSYGQQLMTRRVYFEQIELVPMGHDVVITGGEVELHPVAVRQFDRYEHALRAGADAMLEEMTTLCAAHPLLYRLSGGWDSRAFFAAMLRGNLHRSSHAWTFPALRRDFRVVCGLVRRYGGRFSESPIWLSATRPQSLHEAFARFRSRHLGIYATDVAFDSHVRSSFDVNTAFVVFGGGGECFRNFYFAYRDELTSTDVQNEIASHLRRVPYAPKQIESLSERMRVHLLALPAPTVHGSLRRHYLEFRNRFHFGTSTLSVWNLLHAHPLMQQSLLEASLLAGDQAVARGAIHHDLMAVGDAALPHLPFDQRDKAFAPTVIERSFFARRPDALDFDTDPSVYAPVELHVDAPPARFSPRERTTFWLEQFDIAFQRVREDALFGPFCTDAVRDYILSLRDKKPVHFHQWSGAFMGTADLLTYA